MNGPASIRTTSAIPATPLRDAETAGAQGTGAQEDATGGRLLIDLDAVARNYRTLRETATGARVSAVVKADGYGLGALPIARRLAAEGCDFFYVGHLQEALELRRDGGAQLDRADIAVLNGLPPGTEAIFADNRLLPVLNTLEEIGRWAAFGAGRGRDLPAWIHVDTGMNRLGLDRDDWAAFVAKRPWNGLTVAGVMSHLACADDPEMAQNVRQLSRFRDVLGQMDGVPASLANSGGTFLGRDYHFDMVRPGIALYGGNPFRDQPNPVEEAVRLQARVLQVRRIDKGESVGYGATYVAETPRRIATLSAGYADGFLRAIGNRGAVAAGGVRLPVIGRVSMDLVTVDVTDAPEGLVAPGSFLDLIGGSLHLEEVAQSAGTIGYEMLTALGRRYARHYIGVRDA